MIRTAGATSSFPDHTKTLDGLVKMGYLLARVSYNTTSISFTCFSSMCEEVICQPINYENSLTFTILCTNMLMKTKKE